MQGRHWMKRAVAALALPLAVSTALAAGTQVATAQSPVPTQETQAGVADGRLLDHVEVVGGTQPGPRLWQVRKGEHVLHVLATVAPLPSGMQWDSDRVQGVIARSQEYLLPPGLSVTANVGVFQGLRLLPAYLRVQKNADGKVLKDVLSPPLYARFSATRQRYLPRDRGIENKRPFVAGQALYAAALKGNGLGGKPLVTPVLMQAAKRHGLLVTTTGTSIKLDDPRQALAEVQREQFDDARCLREVLDSIDHELPAVARRANAWATGDIASLRALVGRASSDGDCLEVIAGMDFARKRGIRDVPQRMRTQWLAAAEAALSRNASTFAALPLEQVVGPGSYLDALRAKGYQIIEP